MTSFREATGAGLPQAGGAYSVGLQAGSLIFVSGQAPFDPRTGELVGGTIGDQTAASIENLERVLDAFGATLGHVVKTTVYLSDLQDFEEFDETYGRYFSVPRPTRTTVGAALGGFLIEIDAIAAV
jgi:2-iminobutanoate/2-iminopropanoate deaminase